MRRSVAVDGKLVIQAQPNSVPYSSFTRNQKPVTPYQQRMAQSEEVIEDVHAYIETLEKAQDLGLGIVSFRH